MLRYDQRGHGGTDAPPGKYSFDMLVGDVIGLMDALSIKRAHFCGLSMGGMTALFLASATPTASTASLPCDCGPASTPQSAQQWKERIDLGAEKGMEALVDVTVNRWFPPDFVATKAPVLDKVRGMIRTTPYQGFAGCAYALSDFDPRPGLAGIKNPLLCIVGTKDATVAGIEAIHAAVPGLEARRARRRRPHLQYRAAREFHAGVRDFIKG